MFRIFYDSLVELRRIGRCDHAKNYNRLVVTQLLAFLAMDQ